MRSAIITLFLIFSLLSCQKDKISDVQSEYFLKHFDIDYLEDVAYDVDLTPDGGYIVAGISKNIEQDKGTDMVIVRLDKFGNYSWLPIIIESAGNDSCKAVITAEDGFIVAGSVNGRMAIKKLGTNGQELWSTSGLNEGVLNDIALAGDKIFVVGYSGSSGRQPFRAVFDHSGNLLDESIPPFLQSGDYFTSMVQDGEITSCYGSEKRNGNWNIFIIEHGAQGSWSTEETVFNEPDHEESARIIPGSSGGFFIIGTIKRSTSPSLIFLRKLNADYSVDGSFSYSDLEQAQGSTTGLGGSFRGADICEMKNGNIAVLADRTASNDVNIVLFILADNGSVISSKVFGSSGDQTAASVKNTDDNGLIILGSNKYQGNSMFTLIKTDSEGEIWE